jgi:hypothetical protein
MPTFASQFNKRVAQAKVAQLVERDLAKVEVAGSNPVFRSFSVYILQQKRRDGEIGRHAGLKIL